MLCVATAFALGIVLGALAMVAVALYGAAGEMTGIDEDEDD